MHVLDAKGHIIVPNKVRRRQNGPYIYYLQMSILKLLSRIRSNSFLPTTSPTYLFFYQCDSKLVLRRGRGQEKFERWGGGGGGGGGGGLSLWPAARGTLGQPQ